MAVVDGEKKKKTDPGPFTGPPTERMGGGESSEAPADAPRNEGVAPAVDRSQAAADAEPQLPGLFRFQEIPVTDELRRELLEAKLPLASAEQLVDTCPPNRAVMAQAGGVRPVPVDVDRSAPTEPALPRVEPENEPEPESDETPASSDDVYSATAPTLLNLRSRRMRNWRFVVAGLAVVAVALGAWLWVRESLQVSDSENVVNDTTKPSRHIAGSSPQSTTPPGPARSTADEPALTERAKSPAGSASARDEATLEPVAPLAEAGPKSGPVAPPRHPSARPHSKIGKPPAPAPATETLTQSPSRPAGPKSAPPKAPDQHKEVKPASGKKSFDPEELIF